MGIRRLITPTVSRVWRGTMEPEIPPPGVNYNQMPAWFSADYVREFKENACLRELPFLMREARLTPSSCLLDYGCGLGRLAFPASKYLSKEGAFFGYEQHPDALAFVQKAYRAHPNFHFDGRALRLDEDYVAVGVGEQRSGGVSAMNVDLSFVKRPVDVQWSSSVFTHMWIDPIVEVLRAITKVLAPDGVSVNTWLCVDDFAAYTLRCGVADRALPFERNGALLMAEDNPLQCTAYRLETVEEIYRRADHVIVDKRWGSWSGRDNGAHYQDIIVSRPRRPSE